MSNRTVASQQNKDEWEIAADNAREAASSAGEMVNHAGAAVGAMASQAANDMGKRVDDLTASAGAGIQTLGERLRKVAPKGGVSQAVGRTVKDSGEYIENAKLSGMSSDLAELIRQNPIPSVLIALGLGWFVGRKLGN